MKRPPASRAALDFSGPDDGALVLEGPGFVGDVGVYLSAGPDTDPPSHDSYRAELFRVGDELLVRAVQLHSSTSLEIGGTPERATWRASSDGGRSWRKADPPPSLEQAQVLDRIAAG